MEAQFGFASRPDLLPCIHRLRTDELDTCRQQLVAFVLLRMLSVPNRKSTRFRSVFPFSPPITWRVPPALGLSDVHGSGSSLDIHEFGAVGEG